MKPGTVLVLLQARMGSKRLPGKSLMSIAGQSLLAHCVTRLQASGAGRVIVATSTRPEDDVLASAAASQDALVFRGDAGDVLGRMRAAAALSTPEFVVRATADNPAVDPESVHRLLAVMQDRSIDHAVETGLPCGATVEIMTARALRLAAASATAPEDREHVTPYIRSGRNGFRCAVVPAPTVLNRPELRFTVDTWSDLDYMRQVFHEAGGASRRHQPLGALIAAADRVARVDEDVA